MEQFKLDRIEQRDSEVPGKICEIQGDEVKANLTSELGLQVNASGLNVAMAIQRLSNPINGFNANTEDFDLSEVLRNLQVDAPSYVYLNWHHFSTLDKLEFEILCRFFDDIWYPSTDDIDIIDGDLRWIICVDHGGYLKFLRFPDKEI